MNTPKRLSLPIPKPVIKRKHLRRYSWLPDVFRLKGSIIMRIFGPVLTVTLFSTLICYLKSIGHHVVLTNTIVPMLSVVVGLILVFRNGSSYDRYWEGRKSWSTITANVRNLARQIWVNTAYPPEPKASELSDTPEMIHQKKREALQLLTAFPFAVKHYLREEEGTDWVDLRENLPLSFITKYISLPEVEAQDSYAATASSSLSGSLYQSDSIIIRQNATKRVRPKRSKNHLPANAQTPLLSSGHQGINFSQLDSIPVPLLIAHEISRILFYFRRGGFLEVVGPAGTNALALLVSSMIDQMSAMERVANTPIPVSYSIHLKQCVTLYLFALPLTLVTELGWATIPIVTVVAFTFMGIEGIADEIEMPFGNDPSDLPLDRYCNDLREEIHFIMNNLPDGGVGTAEYDDGEGDD